MWICKKIAIDKATMTKPVCVQNSLPDSALPFTLKKITKTSKLYANLDPDARVKTIALPELLIKQA